MKEKASAHFVRNDGRGGWRVGKCRVTSGGEKKRIEHNRPTTRWVARKRPKAQIGPPQRTGKPSPERGVERELNSANPAHP